MNQQKPTQKFPTTASFGGDHMKRSPSELALEALVRPENRASSGEGLFGNFQHHQATPAFGDDLASFGFKNQDMVNGFSTCGGNGETPSWYQNINQQRPCVSATIDSQSSICAGSPTSTLKPKSGDNQASGSSEDEDADLEAGSCDQSNDPLDVKRIRRMVSNRESARRSRRRKQAALQDLELQVDQLNGENVALYKQLTDATQQLRDASTNNRVLKSDVEALRAKVKLAEEMVTRGSLSTSLNQLLQTHLGSPQMLNAQSLSRVANVPPTITVRGQDALFGGAFPGITNNNAGDHVLTGNARSGSGSDTVSGLSEIWSWDSQASTMSK